MQPKMLGGFLGEIWNAESVQFLRQPSKLSHGSSPVSVTRNKQLILGFPSSIQNSLRFHIKGDGNKVLMFQENRTSFYMGGDVKCVLTSKQYPLMPFLTIIYLNSGQRQQIFSFHFIGKLLQRSDYNKNFQSCV